MNIPFLRTRIIEPVAVLLKQGITPEKVSLSLTLGFIVGLFPVVGTTTVMCMLIAAAFRLNMAAILLANWIAYPVQLILLAPFFMTGAYFFGSAPVLHDSPAVILLFRSDIFYALETLGNTVWQAILVWGIVSPFLALILFFSLMPVLRRFLKDKE